jgi:hypothetical protein
MPVDIVLDCSVSGIKAAEVEDRSGVWRIRWMGELGYTCTPSACVRMGIGAMVLSTFLVHYSKVDDDKDGLAS